MSTQQKTLEVIGAILSFKSDTQSLIFTLQEENFNWDAIVKIGSRHLVLPAIYCRLKEKQLLNCLPEDLVLYLEEITTINRNRNLEILKQVNQISQLFNKHHIHHVFLKGTALLAGNYYTDLGERMVGDIDVLVASNQVQEAYELMLREKYTPSVILTFGHKYFQHKHLPRIAKNTVLAAVEIHRKVLTKPYANYLNPSEILKHKRITQSIYIPSATNLLEHNVLNLQLNDQGNYYNFINLRAAYDTCVILKEHSTIDIQSNYSNRLLNNYFLKHSLYLKDINYKASTIQNKMYVALFKFKIEHQWYTNFSKRCLFYFDQILFLINRSWYFIINKNYRKDVIADRERIYSQLKTKLLFF